MRLWVSLVLATILVLMSAPATAHHSFASFWFMDRTVEIEGVVKSVTLVNPHPQMVVEVTDENGQVSEWQITARGTGTAVLRAGWTETTLPVGSRVKIEGNPSRQEGAKAIAAGKFTKPDGTEVWFGGGGGIPQG